VASRYLYTTHLWETVRVRNGAYGVTVWFDVNSGTWLYCSYRDPNLLKTIQAFDGESVACWPVGPSADE